jgi:hypothetical protein
LLQRREFTREPALLRRRIGVTEVEVAPITVPLPDGHIKLGDGALEANNNVTVTTQR